MHRISRASRTQRGNILFLILLAVVLFAALNYAVTSSMRGGGKNMSEEDAELKATQIIQYATLIENTFQRLKLRGCGIDQISFEHAEATAAGLVYANPRAPSDKRCHMFDPAGGGVTYQSFEGDFINLGSESDNCFGGTCLSAPWAHRGHFRLIGTSDFPIQSGISNGSPGQVAETVMAFPFIASEICDLVGPRTYYSRVPMWMNHLLGPFLHRKYAVYMDTSTVTIREGCSHHTGAPLATGNIKTQYWRIISLN